MLGSAPSRGSSLLGADVSFGSAVTLRWGPPPRHGPLVHLRWRISASPCQVRIWCPVSLIRGSVTGSGSLQLARLGRRGLRGPRGREEAQEGRRQGGGARL